MKERKFLDESMAIFDQLLRSAHSDIHGLYWDTIFFADRSGERKTIIREDIYSGNAGIILYMIELYKVSGEELVKETTVQAISWLIRFCDEHPLRSYAFYSGRSGVSYVLLKAFKLFGDERYLDSAKKYLAQCNEAFREDRAEKVIDDLLNGVGGLLLANLHMNAHFSKEHMFGREIEEIAGYLVGRANYGARGMYWDRGEEQISGLCGFSHGVSGMAWIFSELSLFFRDDFFLGIAQQAMYYEDIFFDKALNNWPDMRREIRWDDLKPEDLGKYRDEIGRTGDNSRYMTAWCHGAPGIGLSRYRCFQIGNDRKVLRKAELALETTIDFCDRMMQQRYNYTLCHGIGGNAYLLLKFFKFTGDQRLLEKIHQYGEKAIEQKRGAGYYFSGYANAEGETLDLFTGITGIGYFFLQCFDAGNDDLDILQPIPSSAMHGNLIFLEKKKRLLSAAFPKSTTLLWQVTDLEKRELDFFSRTLRNDLISALLRSVDAYNGEYREEAKAVFTSERKALNIGSKMVNNYALCVYQYLNHKEAREIVPSKLVAQTVLRLSGLCFLVKSGYDWSGASELSQIVKKVNYRIIALSCFGVNVTPINILEGAICMLCRKELTIANITHKIRQEFSLSDESTDIATIVGDSVGSLVRQGILVVGG